MGICNTEHICFRGKKNRQSSLLSLEQFQLGRGLQAAVLQPSRGSVGQHLVVVPGVCGDAVVPLLRIGATGHRAATRPLLGVLRDYVAISVLHKHLAEVFSPAFHQAVSSLLGEGGRIFHSCGGSLRRKKRGRLHVNAVNILLEATLQRLNRCQHFRVPEK